MTLALPRTVGDLRTAGQCRSGWGLGRLKVTTKQVIADDQVKTPVIAGFGEVAEWLNAPHSKCGRLGDRSRGFESPPLRHVILVRTGDIGYGLFRRHR